MNLYKTSLLIVLVFLAPPAASGQSRLMETLDLFVGEWQMELVADPRTFGQRGGPGSGIMKCDWGAGTAWVDCDLEAQYEGLGRYTLKIVLYNTGGNGQYGAFVTNSFGGGRLYTGKWNENNELVYVDAWVDPDRKWQHQRTTYRFSGPDELSYIIEVSRNGTDFLPHSSGRYRRK